MTAMSRWAALKLEIATLNTKLKAAGLEIIAY